MLTKKSLWNNLKAMQNWISNGMSANYQSHAMDSNRQAGNGMMLYVWLSTTLDSTIVKLTLLYSTLTKVTTL